MSLTIKCEKCGEVISSDNFWHHDHNNYEFEAEDEKEN